MYQEPWPVVVVVVIVEDRGRALAKRSVTLRHNFREETNGGRFLPVCPLVSGRHTLGGRRPSWRLETNRSLSGYRHTPGPARSRAPEAVIYSAYAAGRLPPLVQRRGNHSMEHRSIIVVIL